MTQPTLGERVSDYFERQIAWLEELLEGFEPMERDVAAGNLQEVIAKQEANAQTTRALEEEFLALWKEWQAQYDTVPEADRLRVNALTERAEELSVRLAQMSENAAARVEGELARVKRSLQDLRRNRENRKRYGQESMPDPGFMDEKT